MTVDQLVAWVKRLRKEYQDAGAKMFLGIPEVWYEKPGPKYRCVNDHVSTMILKSEGLGRDACLECMGAMVMTFPEDKDGPAPEHMIPGSRLQLTDPPPRS